VKRGYCSGKDGIRKRMPSALTAILPKARKSMDISVAYGDI
jgi:hypothetical protein